MKTLEFYISIHAFQSNRALEWIVRRRYRAYSILSAVVVVIAIYYLVGVWTSGGQAGVPLDDAWIHFTYARNLADYGELSFNKGEPSTGTTSFLWTLLLATGYLISKDPLWTSIVLNIALSALLIIVLYELGSEIYRGRIIGFIFALACALIGNLMWLTLSGMETILFLFLGFSALLFYSKERYKLCGAALGALTLTRPEGLCLVLILAITEWITVREKTERRKINFSLLIAPLICVMIYFSINLLISGKFLTSTFEGRRWLAKQDLSVDLSIAKMLSEKSGIFLILNRWVYHLRKYLFGLFSWINMPGKFLNNVFLSIFIIPILSGIYICALNFIKHLKETNTQRLKKLLFLPLAWVIISYISLDTNVFMDNLITIIVLYLFFQLCLLRAFDSNIVSISKIGTVMYVWFILHNLMYAVLIPWKGHAGRYQAINLILVTFFLIAGIALVYKKIKDMKNIRSAILLNSVYYIAILLVTATYVGSTIEWRDLYISSVLHINRVHVSTGKWINENIPKDAVLAAYDIGAIGYYSQREIIDLGGLVDPSSIRYLFSGNAPEFMRKKKATHLAMVESTLKKVSLGDRMGIYRQNGKKFKLTPLHNAEVPIDEYLPHWRATGNAYPKIVVYRIKWLSSKDGSRR